MAMEEYIAKEMSSGNYFFSWQTPPTVVMGRNQVAHLEVNLGYCKANHIDVVRRKSGGGCIFSDKGNTMLSLITGEAAVEPLFREYAQKVAKTLQEMGIPARSSGRNDIELEQGGKVSGNAFYHLRQRNIVHGTMLFDTDFGKMLHALTPDRAKTRSKGVKSVKSRVALLKDFYHGSLKDLRIGLEKSLTSGCLLLQESDIQAIRTIEREYLKEEYLYGKDLKGTLHESVRVDGVGNITLAISLCERAAGGGSQEARDNAPKIADISLFGDFFENGDANAAFKKAFLGESLSEGSINQILEVNQLETVVRSMKRETLTFLFSRIIEQSKQIKKP